MAKLLLTLLLVALGHRSYATSTTHEGGLPSRNRIDQTQAQADAKSAGCLECHQGVEPMHSSPNVVLGCTDCHGGNATPKLPKEKAHILPSNPDVFNSSANPPNSTVALNHESPEFIRFMNPGDLRAAEQACGLCHKEIVNNASHSMMAHGAMLWNAAAYNNGAIPFKNPLFGQGYGEDGVPLVLKAPFEPTAEETRLHGWLPMILPLPKFNLGQPGNIFRIFEKGGSPLLEIGKPNLEEPPGKPERRLSARGLGTALRIDSRGAKDASPRSSPRLPRFQRSPRRLPLQRLLGLPRRLRQ